MHKRKLPHKILVVDDEPATLEAVRFILEDDYDVLTTMTGENALEIVSRKNIDLIFLDILMPGGIDGIEVLRKIKQAGENIHTIMLTSAGAVDTAVLAMKLGAYDYITKPFKSDQIIVAAKRALDNHYLVKEINYFRSQVESVEFDHIVGDSAKIRHIYQLISKIAKNDVTVIITGESGTGKELVSRAIHCNSLRSSKPFVTINCAAIPENLVETELFGYEKGAFTGAETSKPGKFELAHGGTIFLDEISSLRLDMQAKLLRVLQEREIERVGGMKTIKVDVRIICATNLDLKQRVEQGYFREDLYYRLNVVPIYLPALRNRREDIPSLVKHFLKLYSNKFQKNVCQISQAALEALVNYSWPGNVRELENMIERLVVLVDKDIIEISDLPFDIFLESRRRVHIPSDNNLTLKQARNNFEREYILAVLERVGWNQTAAAKLLGVHRNTLIIKLEQLDIQRRKRVA